MGSRRQPKKQEADLLGSEGGFKSLLWVPTGIIISLEMSNRDCACTGHRSLATRSQVINTAGLCNDYTFRSGLQSQEIGLGSPDHFPSDRCGLAIRLLFLGQISPKF